MARPERTPTAVRFPTPVTIIEPGSAASRNGDTVADWDNPSSNIKRHGWLAQTVTAEQIGGRDVTITSWELLLPTGTAISSIARVEGDDKAFEVDGEPNRLTFGMNPHVAVRLRFIAEIVAS